MIWPPTVNGPDDATFASERSACGVGDALTVVVAVALLFAELGSEVDEVTVAVLPSGPAAVGVTTIVTVADPAGAIAVQVHVTVVVPLQLPPPVADALTKVTLAGSVSPAETAIAASGPAFATVSV